MISLLSACLTPFPRKPENPSSRLGSARLELEKRTDRPGTPSRVRDAVAELLAAPAAAFPDHLIISRDRDGRPRLLKTNF